MENVFLTHGWESGFWCAGLFWVTWFVRGTVLFQIIYEINHIRPAGDK